MAHIQLRPRGLPIFHWAELVRQVREAEVILGGAHSGVAEKRWPGGAAGRLLQRLSLVGGRRQRGAVGGDVCGD